MREWPERDEDAGPRRALSGLSHALASLTGAGLIVALGVFWLRPKERAAAVVMAESPASSTSASAISVRGPPTGKVRPGPPTMQHLDAARTNRSPFLAPRNPRSRFTYDAGGPIAAAPIAVGNAILVASLGGRVALVDRDGKERARIDLHERVYGSPLLVDDVVYLGVDGGALVALDAEKLTVRFRVPTEGDVDSAILPASDDVIVAAAGRGLIAVDPHGTIAFRVREKQKVYGAPCLAPGGTIVFGAQDDAIVGVGLDGHERFRVAAGGDVDAGCAVGDDGTIYVGDDGREVLALAPDDGRVLFRHETPGYVRGALSVARDGAVLVSTYGKTPSVLALDGKDGHELFRFSIRGTGTEEFGIHGAPLEDRDGLLVFGAQDDFVYGLDPQGGLVFHVQASGDVDQAIVLIDDGLLVVGASDGVLTAFAD